MTDARKKLLLAYGWRSALVLGTLLIAALIVVACNDGPSTSGMGTVNVSLSDPATCAAPDGPYANVWVTITDVQANSSSTAGAGDSGWVDLTANSSNLPMQIDLLGQANNQCFLAMLGDAEELQAGTYQQIRLILADNGASITNNHCGTAANCVVLSTDLSVHTLQLSSESKTGIKIPSGQIASGGFTIAAGQTKDLNIDFNTCASIVQEGNGQYRLKPVLHAGEVSTTSSSLNGKVVDSATGNPVIGAVAVTVEQKDSTGVDRAIMSKPAGSDGSFVFCPLPAGTYDVVVVGTRSDGTLYQPSIITGVAVGDTTGTVSLHPAAITASSATFVGLVTSQNSSSAATAADFQISALETVSSVVYTIPLPPTTTQSMATLSVETAASTTTLTCLAATDCASYTLEVPSGGPWIGAWSSSGSTLTQSAPLATYTVDALATVPSSGGIADCTPSELQSTPPSVLSGTGPFAVTIPTLAFTMCQ